MPKYKVRLTAGAERDLDSIRAYIASQRDEDAADKWLDDLEDVVESLETFPERGPVPPELQGLGIDAFRQLLTLKPYRIIYRAAPGRVNVMIIAHGRRDFQSLLEERLLGS